MKSICLALGAFALSAAPSFAQEAASEADWYPSEYGADDRLGAVANLSEEKTAAAARLIQTGKTDALGQITSRNTPTVWGLRSMIWLARKSLRVLLASTMARIRFCGTSE